MKRLLGIAAAASALVLAVSGCANYSDTGSGSQTTASGDTPVLVQSGKLTVCTHLAYKPFQFKDSDNKTVGFDVDLMDLVATKLGVTQEIVDIEFEQITSGAVFAAKKCDVGAAAITIRAEREEAAAFSDPYFAATQALLVKQGSSIKSLTDLKGKVLAVQSGTTGQDYANENKDQYGYEVKVFDDMPSGANAVLAGTADANVNDNGVLFAFAKDNPTSTVVTEFSTGEEYGFNMSKDNTAMLKTVNEVLKTAKEDGTYNTIYKKWFGVDAPQ
ncbi:transporter substrate-binding domain-containing protein [Propionicicella superfundia]|uniref:transporter substrate-binding domain-containing protein n=1 Tax=Propionicicella superfundia TaxID=348582 RepID=UPI00042092EF|nr:transporter substrate-binding domain-containing protein [Propionicicella superfundia]